MVSREACEWCKRVRACCGKSFGILHDRVLQVARHVLHRVDVHPIPLASANLRLRLLGTERLPEGVTLGHTLLRGDFDRPQVLERLHLPREDMKGYRAQGRGVRAFVMNTDHIASYRVKEVKIMR